MIEFVATSTVNVIKLKTKKIFLSLLAWLQLKKNLLKKGMGKCVEKLNRLDFTIKTHKYYNYYNLWKNIVI